LKDVSGHFRRLIADQLPEDARVLAPDGGPDVIVLVTWRLKNDVRRPRKRSRMIRIVIAEEAIEDYARGSDGLRLASDGRFVAWLQEQLEAFDPDHQAPLGVEPPGVAWLVGTRVLNG
jgi:hypothetical protein